LITALLKKERIIFHITIEIHPYDAFSPLKKEMTSFTIEKRSLPEGE